VLSVANINHAVQLFEIAYCYLTEDVQCGLDRDVSLKLRLSGTHPVPFPAFRSYDLTIL